MQESFGKRIWRLIYPMLTYMAVLRFVEFMALSLISMTYMMNNKNFTVRISPEVQSELEKIYSEYINEINIAAFICVIPLLILFMYLDRKRRAQAGKSEAHEKTSLYKYIFVPVLGALCCVAWTFMIIMGGFKLNGMNNYPDVFFCGKTVIELIALGILSPAANELLLRGVLYNRLKENTSVMLSALMISFFSMFSAYSIPEAVYLFIMSLLSVYLYERYHSIIAPVLLNIGAAVIAVLEREEKVLSTLYSSWSTFLISTIGFVVLTILLLCLIEKLVLNKQEKDPFEIKIDIDMNIM